MTLVNYFDSNRLMEFDTVSFDKNINWGNDFWKVTDGENVCYHYNIGFPSSVSDNYKFPVSDSLERIWISDFKVFTELFPMKIHLPEKNIEIILKGNGLIDIRTSWMNNDYDGRNAELYNDVGPKRLFERKNPFEYFRTRTKTMDSLGVEGIGGHSFGNVITIVLKDELEFIDYLPDNLLIKESYRSVFDSVISKGIKINKNWVWRKAGMTL